MRSWHAGMAFLLVITAAGCRGDGRGDVAAQTAADLPQHELRRVWVGTEPNFYAAEPSPDGRGVSEIDWSTGDLAIRDLTTGELRRITKKGTWADNTDYAEFSTFAPDGQRLAYTWFREGEGYQLREIGIDGTGERVLVPHHPDLDYIAAEDWSPDGRLILATVFRADRSSQIATVAVETGELRVLRSSDWRHPWVAAFSRDSRWIAFDFQPDEDARHRDIYVMATDGSRETRVVTGPANDVLLGWLHDDSGILFYSNRGQTRAIWRQSIRDGRAVGEPSLVRSDVWQLFPLGFAGDDYFYGVDVELPQVHTATIDHVAGRLIVQPAAVQDPSSGQSSFGAWAPDGRFFAFIRQSLDRGKALVIRSADGTDAREVRLDIDEARHMQWEPGSTSVLLMGTDRKGRTGIHRVHVGTGAHELVTLHEPRTGDLGRFHLTPDGKSILYWLPRETGDRGFNRTGDVIARDLASGAERTLHEFRSPGPAFVSPDAMWYVKKDFDLASRINSLRVGRTDGTGEPRTIYTTSDQILQNRGGFPFTPDGRHVLVAVHPQPAGQADGDRGHTVLLQVPVAGGDPVVLLEWDGLMQDLRMSADGRRISFGSGQPRGEIWMLSGVAGITAAR